MPELRVGVFVCLEMGSGLGCGAGTGLVVLNERRGSKTSLKIASQRSCVNICSTKMLLISIIILE